LIRDIYSFPRIIKEVISFITKNDNPSPLELKEKRKVFVGGGSLGGWASLEYGLSPNENAAGIIAWVLPHPFNTSDSEQCPMIYTVGESTPNIVVQYVARFLIKIGLGWLPLAPANKGKSSTPENEAKFFSDPQTYHGNLRVATGLQLLDGMYHIRANMGSFKMPVLLCHGKRDRVTEWQGSQKFYNLCGSVDKEIVLYDEMQHDLMREPGVDEILIKTRDWILERLN
jgi:acylglycerol lipase